MVQVGNTYICQRPFSPICFLLSTAKNALGHLLPWHLLCCHNSSPHILDSGGWLAALGPPLLWLHLPARDFSDLAQILLSSSPLVTW